MILNFVKLLRHCDKFEKEFKDELTEQDIKIARHISLHFEYLDHIWFEKHYDDVYNYLFLTPKKRREYKCNLVPPGLHLLKVHAYTYWSSVKDDVLHVFCLSDEEKAALKVQPSTPHLPYKYQLLCFSKLVNFHRF